MYLDREGIPNGQSGQYFVGELIYATARLGSAAYKCRSGSSSSNNDMLALLIKYIYLSSCEAVRVAVQLAE